ncbi:MAG: TIGR03960 family B12-binding radical SAM protein [Anaerolineae bacterium]|nr:TIGR03960 family B12-binding radical SAM protein [Anaerolineae bacterium]MDW8098961.1 TIGR03960 family B12-binding radical SAM protein [Anaerolineae bacterium]
MPGLRTPEEISRTLDRVLHQVQKPARYIGGEWNSIVKDWDQTSYKIALAFPDIYELGMSNLGLMILYDIVNRQPDMLAERVYAPWVDMEAIMRREGIPLFSLETRHPLADFDIIGFSLPYEQLYTNVLNMLDLAGIPLRSADRTLEHPLIIAGGSATYNPEPMHAFIDAFVIGEGEEVLLELIRAYGEWKEAVRDQRFSSDDSDRYLRRELLRRLARIPGVYVPSFYEVSYHADGTVAEVRPVEPEAQFPIVKRIVPVLPPPVTRFIVPYIDIVHNRAAIEIQRGCTRGCRFCQAGMIYRPVRERPLDEILAAVDEMVRSCGFEEVSFLSLSSSDYTHIGELVRRVVERYGDQKLSIGLPSLRIESFSVELMEMLEKGRRRSGFTFAPEAATDRLRDVINKPIATEALLRVAEEVYSRGWTTIKLYFMIGHPTQTMEDVRAIADLSWKVMRIGRRILGGKAKVRVGVSTLVPKPHTPFQWVPMADEETIRAQLDYLQRRLCGRGFHFNWNNPRETLMEAFLSRGDRRLADVIERAWRLGAKFDAWQDQFNDAAWMQAFAEHGLDPDWYARRERSVDEVLPWDHISVGVKKEFLIEEYRHALQGAVIDDCREHCFSCGILGQFKDLRRQAADELWGCPALGRGKARQPVDIRPIPLYFNEEMSPELAATAGPRVPQRASRIRDSIQGPVFSDQHPEVSQALSLSG